MNVMEINIGQRSKWLGGWYAKIMGGSDSGDALQLLEIPRERFIRMNHHVLSKWVAMLTCGVIGAWLQVPYAVKVLVYLMFVNLASGLIAAAYTKTLCSDKMYKGLLKNFAMFPFLTMLHLIEKSLKIPFEFETVAAVAFILYMAMSIVENSAKAGLPIPAIIVDALAQAKIKTLTAEEIRKKFAGNSSSATSSEASEIVKTPPDEPDLLVVDKVTVLKERHITPIDPNAASPIAPEESPQGS